MNTQLNQLQRLLTEIDSCLGSIEVQMLMREARRDAIGGRRAVAKALKIANGMAQPSPAQEEWRAMAGAPKDGSLVRLLVRFDEHSIDDGEGPFATIGQNNMANDGEDRWQVVGWCWEYDHFTDGKGTPLGWLPLLADDEKPDDQAFDRNAERLTAEAFGTGGGINPNATSIDDLFLDESTAPELELPEVVAWQYEPYLGSEHYGKPKLAFVQPYSTDRNVEQLMTVAQHDRIVGVLRAVQIETINSRNAYQWEYERATQERDAAQARVAELEASCQRSDCDQRENDAMLEAVTAELNALRASRSAVDLSGIWRYGFKGTDFGMMDDGPYVLMEQVQKALSAPVAHAGQVPEGFALVPDHPNVDAIVTSLYRRFKDWSSRGFGPEDVTWCEVKADLLALATQAGQEPEVLRSLLVRAQGQIEHLAECTENLGDDLDDDDVSEDVAEARALAEEIGKVLTAAPQPAEKGGAA